MGAGDSCVDCLAWLANPTNPPSNVPFLVFVRFCSLFSLFASFVIWTLACIYRPWKLQMYKGHQMEIGIWKICRVTPKVYQCYSGWYELHFKWWFWFFRYLMVGGIALQVLTFCGMCIELVRKKRLHPKPWRWGAIINAFSSLCFFTSLILFYLKFEWELAEQNFGWPIMGWNEETPDKPDYIETVGFPYIMAWTGLVILFVSTYMFYYTSCEELLYIKEEKKKKREAAKLRAKLKKPEAAKPKVVEEKKVALPVQQVVASDDFEKVDTMIYKVSIEEKKKKREAAKLRAKLKKPEASKPKVVEEKKVALPVQQVVMANDDFEKVDTMVTSPFL